MKRMYYIGYMLCLLLAGCVVGEKADGLLEQRLSDRTLLVYMGGDNDLADETDEKLSALTEAWDRFPGHLLIYQDKKGADSTRLLEVCLDEQGEKVTKILAKYKQENSAGASVFARVVNEAMARYPYVDQIDRILPYQRMVTVGDGSGSGRYYPLGYQGQSLRDEFTGFCFSHSGRAI